jgi:spermidine synthase
MLELGKNNPIFLELNKNSLNNSKLTTFAEDAFNFLENTSKKYDAIFIDLPDPNNIDLNKLYCR